MLKKLSVVILFFVNFSSLNAEILFKNDDTNKKLQVLAEEKIYSNKTAGMVVLVVKNGEIQYLKAFGYAELKNNGKIIRSPKKMQTETIFDLASLTKVLATTQAVMMLIENGKLKLDDKASNYLVGFQTPEKSDITIYDLLTHSSGLSPWKPLYLQAKNQQEALDYISDLPLAYHPRTNQIYSDLGFIILGMIVEVVSGDKLDVYLNKNLYSKLDMIDTEFNPRENKKERSASTSWNNLFEQNMIAEGKFGVKGKPKDFKHWRNYTLKGEVDDGNAYYSMQGVSGHAGLFSTAPDIAKLMFLMLNGGSYNGVSFYSQDIINDFSAKQSANYLKGRAIGFDYSRDYMGKNRKEGTFGHIGFTGACLVLNKAENLGIIILTNRENVGLNSKGGYTGFNDLCGGIMDIVYENYQEKK